MEQKPVNAYTDLELAEIIGQQFQQLMAVQQNIQAIQMELARRKPVPQPEPKK